MDVTSMGDIYTKTMHDKHEMFVMHRFCIYFILPPTLADTGQYLFGVELQEA